MGNNAQVDEQRCEMCGRPVSVHDRHLRFRLPQPVLNSPAREQTAGTWLSHRTADESVMMQVPNVGPFVRALLPVKLSGGHTITFGVWVAIHPDDLQRADAVWHEPEYADLRLDGILSNPVKPWGLLYAPVSLQVRDPEHTPYCSASRDPQLSRVLSDEWPHETVLAACP
jgi:hypothetical protein